MRMRPTNAYSHCGVERKGADTRTSELEQHVVDVCAGVGLEKGPYASSLTSTTSKVAAGRDCPDKKSMIRKVLRR